MSVDALGRNLLLYRWHQRAAGALFWAPTAFLFFVDRFGLTQALQIQSVYYLAVVVFEVPSGWFSDRFGRVPTLRVAALLWIVAHAVFSLTDSALAASLAQVLLAGGFACISGTDVTFHYDTLEALGEAHRFDDREARIRRQLLVTKAASAAVGGALAFVDLRLPFVAAGVAAAAQLGIAGRFTAPTRAPEDAHNRAGIKGTVELVRRPLLAWITLFVLCQVVTIHLAAELGAPYLAVVLEGGLDDPATAALANGALSAAVALVGAASLGRLTALTGMVGVTAALSVIAFVPSLLLVIMAIVSAVWVIPLLALRGVQSAASTVLVAGVVGTTVDPAHRATFLSFTSLLGRLGYGLALLGLSAGDGFDANVTTAAITGMGLAMLVAISRPLLPDADRRHARSLTHEHGELVHEHVHGHGDDHHRDHDHDESDGPHAHEHVHPALTHRHTLIVDLHHAPNI